jgi:hypothetical protein
MNINTVGKLVIFGVVLALASACEQVPTRPSMVTTNSGSDGLVPSNISRASVGTASEVCDTTQNARLGALTECQVSTTLRQK